jgi:hypothetical protein
MFSHIFENSVSSFFLPARMIMQEVTPETAHYKLGWGKEKPKVEDEPAPPKKPETDANKPKEGGEGEKKAEEKTKEELKKLKEGVSKGLFENKEEHNKIREAIENIDPQKLREYYDTHEPEKYNGRMWLEWNMDFVKNVMVIKDATALTARKYAWVFQEWLRDKGFNPGVDGKIGKKTTEALGGYLCSIGGNDDICKKIGGKPGEGRKEVEKGGLEFSMENLNQFYNIYIQALRKENPTLDIGRGYIVNKDVFKGIFEDIVNGGPTFDPHDIEGWKAHFADLLYSGLSDEQELFQIYPYSLEGTRKEVEAGKEAMVVTPFTAEEIQDYADFAGPKYDTFKGDYFRERIQGQNKAAVESTEKGSKGILDKLKIPFDLRSVNNSNREEYANRLSKTVENWKIWPPFIREKITGRRRVKDEYPEDTKLLISYQTIIESLVRKLRAGGSVGLDAIKSDIDEAENKLSQYKILSDKKLQEEKEKQKESYAAFDAFVRSHDMRPDYPGPGSIHWGGPSEVTEKTRSLKDEVISMLTDPNRTRIFKTFHELLAHCDKARYLKFAEKVGEYEQARKILAIVNNVIFDRNEAKFDSLAGGLLYARADKEFKGYTA